MQNKVVKKQTPEQEVVFSLQELLKKCVANWKWFAISVIIFCGLGAWYALRQEPIYKRTMEVLIKDQDGGGGMADISSAFSSLGLVSSNTNVNNELISLTSPAVMYEVIEKLGLDVSYATPGRFHLKTLYGTNLPFIVKFKDIEEQTGGGLVINLGKDGSKTLEKFKLYTIDGVETFDDEIKMAPGQTEVKTPLGIVEVTPNPIYTPSKSKKQKPITKIMVGRDGMQSTVELYSGKLKGDLADKDADVIELTMKDESIERAVDVLNSIVEVYNESWIKDKNKIAVATSKFIDERLASIREELGVVDSDISKYKSENLVPDLTEAAKLSMKENADVSKDMLDLSNKMTMCIYLRDYVNNPANANAVIPVNTGIGSPTLETDISTYNALLLNRNSLVQNSSEKNPLVQDYDVKIKGLRESIVRGINAQVSSLEVSMKNLRGAKGDVVNQLATGPSQAKYLISVEREQKVKQELYLYLLQKSEENDLNQKFTADNTRIITPPMGSLLPVAPKKKLIVAVAFLIGLLVPGVWIYILSVTDTKVRSKKDIEGISAPFAGEIPMVGRDSKFKKILKKVIPQKKSDGDLENVIEAVKDGSRDIVSESFRIVRSNLEFMVDRKAACNVIMFTSNNPGSGKSFIAYNLGASFALKNKKVLLVDCDLRHGSASQFVGMPSKGICTYLRGLSDTWKGFVVPVAGVDGLSVMPIGNRPPNPAELLDTEKFAEFVKEASQDYDFILMDCPPANLVADTKIISKYADSTVFIIRAGLFDKNMITELDAMYKDKVYPQMSIVLNGTENYVSKKHSAGYYGSYYSTEE